MQRLAGIKCGSMEFSLYKSGEHKKARLVMMCVQVKEEFKIIAIWLVIFVCLFFTGCKHKSAANVHRERGVAHYHDGDYDKAFSELNKAIKIDPEDARSYVHRGMAYNDKNDFDLAIADFTKAIEIKPTDAHAYVYRGMAYGNKGEYDLAVTDHSKAIEIDPKITDAYGGRASAYYHKGEYDKAWKDVSTAQTLGHPVDSKLLEKLREASGEK
jgi:tetratricopeptide (TPR) repeat protein